MNTFLLICVQSSTRSQRGWTSGEVSMRKGSQRHEGEGLFDHDASNEIRFGDYAVNLGSTSRPASPNPAGS